MEMLLNKRELLDLGKELQGVKIVCREGCCWITLAGDRHDHIIKHGKSFIVRSKGRVLITAMESSRLLLTDNKSAGRLDQPSKAIYGLLKQTLSVL